MDSHIPKIDFSTFLLSISAAAMESFGKDPLLAKQNIDLLELMQDKTKNNLTADEETLLNHLLVHLRLQYVELMKS